MHFGYGKGIYNNNMHSFEYWMMDSTSDMAAGRNGIALRARLLSSDTDTILPAARVRCAEGHGMIQTYSPKVFIPLTTLCRNVCHYCTFAQEMAPAAIEALIRSAGRVPRQRTTLYGEVEPALHQRALGAAPLAPITLTPVRKRAALESEIAQ